ncbi:MAG TPA: hypothetical protein VMB91_05195 [Solirubrobacteraceae bacterium]|nr:hypothetical protein [Solirubrobacteraceae bacterium]
MVPPATDWSTISALATGVGTLVLAIATFAAVRSSNRSARIAEAALQEQRRPLLVPSRLEDPAQKIMFVDQHWVRATGGHAEAESIDGNVYLAASLRNAGSGIGVCQGWTIRAELLYSGSSPTHAPEGDFHLQSRDLYVPAGDIGMWQGALRNPEDPVREAVAAAIEAREPLTLELLYTDLIGQQRTITRFSVVPTSDMWLLSVTRHWYLDWDGPRAERDIAAAAEATLRDHEAHQRAVSDAGNPSGR